jgi:hypothetical protein
VDEGGVHEMIFKPMLTLIAAVIVGILTGDPTDGLLTLILVSVTDLQKE